MLLKNKKSFASYSKAIKRILLSIVLLVILPLYLLSYYVYNLHIFRPTDIKIAFLVNINTVIFCKETVYIYDKNNTVITIDRASSENCVRCNGSIIYKTCNLGKRIIIEIYPQDKKVVKTDELSLKNDNIIIVFDKHNIFILNKHENNYFRLPRYKDA